MGCVECNGLGEEGWNVLSVIVWGGGVGCVECNGLGKRDGMC